MARLLSFFVVFALFLTYIVFNLDNKCNVNLGFHVFSDVPVYITSFISLLAGMILAIPFLISFRKGNRAPPEKTVGGPKSKKKADVQDDLTGVNGPYGIN